MKRKTTRIAIATKGGFRFAYERVVEKELEPKKEIKHPETPQRRRISMYV